MTAILPLALTMGDPSGIGPELTLKAYAAREQCGLAPFFVVADPAHLKRAAADLALHVAIEATSEERVSEIFARALPVVPLGRNVIGEFGAPILADATATILSIERSVQSVASRKARALVTNPISKSALYAAGFKHPGHTEFLAELAARHWDGAFRSVMMLWSEELAVVPITIHVALSSVPRLLTRELIVSTGRIVDAELRKRFSLANPRLAFAGLNPHAGESGALGREEIDVIAPALAELRALGVDASGPHPADTMFHARAREQYDVALCPTHDQALIPIKTLAFERGVNISLGLPLLRTSPDHGTAYDIAGEGVADPASLIEAIRLADRLTRRSS